MTAIRSAERVAGMAERLVAIELMVAAQAVDLRRVKDQVQAGELQGARDDLIALLRVVDNEAMADLVTRGILEIDGIADSETLVAFRVHSKFDLATIFDVDSDTAPDTSAEMTAVPDSEQS